jgi:hypothetical protein
MEKVWSLLAAILMLAAGVFFWLGNYDYTFVTAVLGSIAWLLDYRAQTKKRRTENAPQNSENTEI